MRTEQETSDIQKKENFICEKCRAEANLPLWETINSAEMPEIREGLLNNSLSNCKCSRCGENIVIEYMPLLYHDPINKFAIHYFPDPTEDDINNLNADDINFSHDELRIVFEYEDLIDKIRIFEANLNDKVMEVCKVIMLRKFYENLNIPGFFTFYGVSADNKYFIFHNTLSPDEDGLINKNPLEGSIYINNPLWRSLFNASKKPIAGGVYIEMSKEIYTAVENEEGFDCRLTKGRWEIADIHYTLGQVIGESAKNAILKNIDENTKTDISKLWH